MSYVPGSRRNTGHLPVKSTAPYNEIYTAFKSVLAPIFADRLPQGRRSKVYVAVPETEAAIDEYLRASTNQVAILHGLMGSGKSTVLEHVYQHAANDPKRYVFPIDFQGKRYHLMPGEDFATLKKDERKLVSKTIVSKRLNEFLNRFLKEHRELINLNFFDFLVENYPSELKRKAILADTDDEKMRALKEFMSDDDGTAPIQCFISYVTMERGIEEFVVYIDNIDEQSFDMVEGVFFALSDLLVCLSRSNDASATPQHPKGSNPTRFRAVMACRSYTFEALTRDLDGILGTRGYFEIELDSQALLTKILEKRVLCAIEDENGRSSSGTRRGTVYELMSGIPVQMADRDDFIWSFIRKLSNSSVETRLFDLFNRSHARALRNMKYILQNRYFLSFDAEVLSKAQFESEFEFTRILKILCYGNPKSDSELFYPAQSSVVSNLLWWDPGAPGTFLGVVRLLQWLHSGASGGKYGHVSSGGSQIKQMLDSLERDFAFEPDCARLSLQFCHLQGLVFSESGPGASLADTESICISPKGGMLLDQLFRDAVLLEAFIDDTCPPEGYENLLGGRRDVIRFGRYPTRDHFRDTLNWLTAFRESEYHLLSRLSSTDPRCASRHVRLFKGNLISGQLGHSLCRSFEMLYKPVCTKTDKVALTDYMLDCKTCAQHFGE